MAFARRLARLADGQMNTGGRLVRALAALSLIPSLVLAQQADEQMTLLQEQEALLGQVAALEQTLGRHDPALVEYLTTLATNFSALDQHDESRQVLERAIQIQRSSNGLFTPTQIPLYFSRLDNDVMLGNWSEINQDIEYLKWLLLEKTVYTDDELISALVRLAKLHLTGVTRDALSEQANHYRGATQTGYLAINLSEVIWGASDIRRVDLHYGLIKLFYLQSLAIQQADDTAYELRAIVPGSTIVRSKETSQARLYYAGLNLFAAIDGILEGNTEISAEEAKAMVGLYRADWHLLFNQDVASEHYTSAYSALAEAAIAEDQLAALFDSPQILPVPRLHLTVEDAIALSRNDARQHTGLALVQDTVADSYFSVQDWYGAIPAIQFPLFAPRLTNFEAVGLREIWLKFSLNSLQKVSRWVSGTYRSRMGVVDEYQLLSADSVPDFDQGDLDDRLHVIQFRPRMVAGIPSPSEGTLVYRVSAN